MVTHHWFNTANSAIQLSHPRVSLITAEVHMQDCGVVNNPKMWILYIHGHHRKKSNTARCRMILNSLLFGVLQLKSVLLDQLREDDIIYTIQSIAFKSYVNLWSQLRAFQPCCEQYDNRKIKGHGGYEDLSLKTVNIWMILLLCVQFSFKSKLARAVLGQDACMFSSWCDIKKTKTHCCSLNLFANHTEAYLSYCTSWCIIARIKTQVIKNQDPYQCGWGCSCVSCEAESVS